MNFIKFMKYLAINLNKVEVILRTRIVYVRDG